MNRSMHDHERRRYERGIYEMDGYPSREAYPAEEPIAARAARPQPSTYGDGFHPSLWQRVKGAFTGKGPKNYRRSDERIHEDVCEYLTHHPYVDASDIEVIVRKGEVTLTGTVEARMVKRAAEECVEHVRGVMDVHNHLKVKRPESKSSR